jgi:blue light- and temperature-responsive anti-repressor
VKRTTMAGSLYRLIYCSRNNIARAVPAAATADGIEQEIRDILVTARRCNAADNVTGALLFTASGFAQVLEGPRDVVERTFDRISSDPRHADVTALSFTPTERRSFPDWSMAFCGRPSPAADDPLAHLLGDPLFARPRVTTGSDVLRMLESAVLREDDWTRTQ